MYHLIIRIEKDGKEIVETERELSVEFPKGVNGISINLSLPHEIQEEIVYETLNRANDGLNANPELWIADAPEVDEPNENYD